MSPSGVDANWHLHMHPGNVIYDGMSGGVSDIYNARCFYAKMVISIPASVKDQKADIWKNDPPKHFYTRPSILRRQSNCFVLFYQEVNQQHLMKLISLTKLSWNVIA
jgi:hypothetical protein